METINLSKLRSYRVYVRQEKYLAVDVVADSPVNARIIAAKIPDGHCTVEGFKELRSNPTPAQEELSDSYKHILAA